MSHSLILRQEAERDLADAYGWYEACVPGLGADFCLPWNMHWIPSKKTRTVFQLSTRRYAVR